MKIHQLKIEKQHLIDLEKGIKKAELRFNDRDYAVGDLLFFKGIALPDGNVRPFTFNKYSPIKLYLVTHIIDSPVYLQPGYVMMSLQIVYLHSDKDYYIPGYSSYPELNPVVFKEFLDGINWIKWVNDYREELI